MIKRASNPFESSAGDWLAMADALEEMEHKLRQSDQHRLKLLAEVEQLEDQLAESNTERKFWMGYSIQIETRLDVISETIQEARNQAREAAKRFTQERDRSPVPEAKPAQPAAPERPRLSEMTRKPVERHPAPPEDEEDNRVAAEVVGRISALSNRWP